MIDSQQQRTQEESGLRSYPWRLEYRTSSSMIDGRPVDILHDFYLPALRHANRYDRVAGYFRSSSLAVASQGFSSFVGRQGHMRLIVGCDLDFEDVKAILDGDMERLSRRLNSELDDSSQWPIEIQRGVQLLGWMVAHDYLEIRVAFRRHRVSGEPMPVDATDDGYVHEKWFIMVDECGDRLYGSGSLNESKTALQLNAENITVHCDWMGQTDRQRVDDAEADFEALWKGSVSHLPVLPLPQAVRQNLIKKARGIRIPRELDGTGGETVSSNGPLAMEWLRFAVLRDGPKFPRGRFVGMETAPVEPWPHQAVVIRRLVQTWPYSYLLCDEVGLGKTIEAGLAMRSLYLSGFAKRIMVAAPAGLAAQWHREMASKAFLPFAKVRTSPDQTYEYIYPEIRDRDAPALFEADLLILSTGLLSRQERAQSLRDANPYDIVLVDEAHAARRRNPTAGSDVAPDYGYLYTNLRDAVRSKAKALWLATATPMQIHPVEACDLLALTDRVGPFQFDPSLTLSYYEVMGKLMNRQDLTDNEWELFRQVILGLESQDPLLWQFITAHVVDRRLSGTLRRWLDSGRAPRGNDQKLIVRLLFSVAPLSRVMMRHTRGLLDVYRSHGKLRENLATRHILPIPPITFTPEERHVYERMERYCKELARRLQRKGDPKTRQMVSFFLSFLRLRFASSFYAFHETIIRRLTKVEATLRRAGGQGDGQAPTGDSLEEIVFEDEIEDDDTATEAVLRHRTKADLEWEHEELRGLLSDLEALQGDSPKMQEVLKVLDKRRVPGQGRIRQTVVFTRFYDTLTDFVKRLRQADSRIRIGTYSGRAAEYLDVEDGRLVTVDREEVKERFLRGEIDVLVCTDAAAEGLNLQTADLLINFDLGWNPMKIEQRIGRIDRIGQRHRDVNVLNLCYAGSAEEIVYGRLLTRLTETNQIVGTQQISLLPVQPNEFQELADGSLSPEELETRAKQRLKEQRQRTATMEVTPDQLYEIYSSLNKEAEANPAPVGLRAIWDTLVSSEYLKSVGCSEVEIQGRTFFRVPSELSGCGGVLLTISRDLFSRGIDGAHEPIHFATYGDPVFSRLLAHIAEFPCPRSIRRIAISFDDLPGVEVVAYGVLEDADGHATVKMVTSWGDMQSLKNLADSTLTDSQMEPLRYKLEELATTEIAVPRAVKRLERQNRRIALGQEWINFSIAKELIEFQAHGNGKDSALSVLSELDAKVHDRQELRISTLPVPLFRSLGNDLLLNARVPEVGDTLTAVVPQTLLITAVDAAKRIVSSMKRRKSELSVGMAIDRLQQEIRARERMIGQ